MLMQLKANKTPLGKPLGFAFKKKKSIHKETIGICLLTSRLIFDFSLLKIELLNEVKKINKKKIQIFE